MASKIKVDQIQTADGTGTIALQNQLSGMTSVSMPTGSVLQVVQGTTNTQVAATGTASTNLSASITPSSTSSKILVLFSQKYYTATTSIYIGMHLYRDAGAIKNWNNTLMGLNHSAYATFQYLDSPSSTSSETYEVYMSISDGSGTIYANANSAPAEITLMEIAG